MSKLDQEETESFRSRHLVKFLAGMSGATFIVTFSVVFIFGPDLISEVDAQKKLAEFLRATSSGIAIAVSLAALLLAWVRLSYTGLMEKEFEVRVVGISLPSDAPAYGAENDFTFSDKALVWFLRLQRIWRAIVKSPKEGQALYSRNTQKYRSNFAVGLKIIVFMIVAAMVIATAIWPLEVVFFFTNFSSTFPNAVATVVNWVLIQKWPDELEKKLFLFFGPAGFSLLFWRTFVANKQANLSEMSLNVDRFRQGCELLASERLIERQAGVVTLKELAVNHKKEASTMVLEVLIDFLKVPNEMIPDNTCLAPTPTERPDLHAAFRAIIVLWKNRVTRSLYLRNNLKLDLENIELKMGSFEGAYLARVSLRSSNFEWCKFGGSNFRETDLTSACFRGCSFSQTNFRFANFDGTDFSGSAFSYVGLTGVHLSGTIFGRMVLGVDEDLPPGIARDAIVKSSISREAITENIFRRYPRDRRLIGLEENNPPMLVSAQSRLDYCKFVVTEPAGD